MAASFEFIAEGYKPRYATRRYDNLELVIVFLFFEKNILNFSKYSFFSSKKKGMRMDYPEQFSCHEGVLGAVVSFVEVFH